VQRNELVRDVADRIGHPCPVQVAQRRQGRRIVHRLFSLSMNWSAFITRALSKRRGRSMRAFGASSTKASTGASSRPKGSSASRSTETWRACDAKGEGIGS
jgi:hypothetical protein